MKIKILVLIFLSLLFSCNDKKNMNSIVKKAWIYLEIEIKGSPKEDAIYGQISETDLNLIKENSKSEKLIMITNVRYNDEEKSIVKDISVNSNDIGTSFYRIKNINYLEILKNDPMNTKVELLND